MTAVYLFLVLSGVECGSKHTVWTHKTGSGS